MNSIGELIDAMYLYRESRKEHEAVIKDLIKREKEIELALYSLLDVQGLKQAAGNLAQFSVSKKEVPSVANWDDVYDYIQETGEFGLLHKRISLGLWKELIDEGKSIPGINAVELQGFTLRVKK
jgi:hypothetical protein